MSDATENHTRWTIGPTLAGQLRRLLRPGMRTLECGSGLSTRLFVAAGCDHLALDHDQQFAATLPQVHVCRLTGTPPWYDWRPSHACDLILIDGPPTACGGRAGILPHVRELAHPDTIFICDDTHRRNDAIVADEIARQLGLTQTILQPVQPADFGRQSRILQASRQMNITATVTTAPRRGTPTLPRTCFSLAKAGFERPLVFAEPEAAVADWIETTAEVVYRQTRLGCWHNWLQSLADTLDRRPDADGILMIQDDVLLCRDLRRFLAQDSWPSPQCGVVQIYLSARYENQRRGLLPLDHQGAYLLGACACLFPRHVARQLVAYGRTEGWRGHPVEVTADPTEKACVDPFIGIALTALGYDVWTYAPSLAEHNATYSTLGHGSSSEDRRHALRFIGEDASPFDHFATVGPRYQHATATS